MGNSPSFLVKKYGTFIEFLLSLRYIGALRTGTGVGCHAHPCPFSSVDPSLHVLYLSTQDILRVVELCMSPFSCTQQLSHPLFPSPDRRSSSVIWVEWIRDFSTCKMTLASLWKVHCGAPVYFPCPFFHPSFPRSSEWLQSQCLLRLAQGRTPCPLNEGRWSQLL